MRRGLGGGVPGRRRSRARPQGLRGSQRSLRIARHVEGKLVGSFKLCLSAAGDVVSVERLRSTGFPAYDATLEAGLRQWKYRPVIEAGQAVPVCTAVTFVYSQS